MTKRSFTVVAIVVLALVGVSAASHAQGVVFVKNNRMGLGTSNPEVLLHLSAAGNSQSFYENTVNGVKWSFSQQGSGGFVISKFGSGKNEFNVTPVGGVNMGGTNFQLSPSGNLTIAGNLTELSSREAKRGFQPVSGMDVLERVTQLPIVTWNYKHDRANVRHLGPVAEDFYESFGLGATESGISSLDGAGVALAAIQGLNEKLENENALLRSELDELRGMVLALAAE